MAWETVIDTMTLEAATYTGNARKVEFTFSAYPEQLDFVNNWLIENFLDNLKKEASAQYGAKVLELRLWRDTSPTWQTNYKGELVTSIPEGFSAIPFAVLAVIVVALAAIAYWFIVKPLLNQVTDFVYGPPDSDGNRPAVPWGTIALVAVAAMVLVPNLTGGKK